jgi:hypothetical protein
VAEHQCGEFVNAVSEEYVGADHQRAYPQFDQGCKDHIEFAFGARLQDMELQPESAGCRLRVARSAEGRNATIALPTAVAWIRRLAPRSWTTRNGLLGSHLATIVTVPLRYAATLEPSPVSERTQQRRALRQLASAPEGITEALMLAHGFPVSLLMDLCMGELAIATSERMVAGGRTVEVVRLKITETGRRALSER